MARLLLQLTCNKIFRLSLFVAVLSVPARAQEPPYFVTYSDVMEEPGNLEISYKGIEASPKNANTFNSATLELEYGLTAYWTTEFYLSGQTTHNDSTIFTGYRWENRFRPLMKTHFINPVLYIEYENINEGDRSFLEVMDHDSINDLYVPNAVARSINERALELKLILSSNTHGWNISENFITEKALNESEPWEFGYALAVSRPLTLEAGKKACVFCRENFSAGLELYGGLGTTDGFGWNKTSQYLGPMMQFNIPKGPSIGFEPAFGLNANSIGVMWRFKVSYEIEQFLSIFKGKSH
ncbi:MAG TPA: hypothetical protein VMH31_11290 [Methylomirabilota bacterium]|nr:hypothetical protein [Methylomirabilota bacterium]